MFNPTTSESVTVCQRELVNLGKAALPLVSATEVDDEWSGLSTKVPSRPIR
jgi:hypothetical protein